MNKLKSFLPILCKALIIRVVFFGIAYGLFSIMFFPICFAEPLFSLNLLFLYTFHLGGLTPRINTWKSLLFEGFVFCITYYCVSHLSPDNGNFIGSIFASYPFLLYVLTAPISILSYMVVDACRKHTIILLSQHSRAFSSWKGIFADNTYSLTKLLIRNELVLFFKILLSFSMIYLLALMALGYFIEKPIEKEGPIYLLFITLSCYITPINTLFLYFIEHRFKFAVCKLEFVFLECAVIFMLCSLSAPCDSGDRIIDLGHFLPKCGNMASGKSSWMISFLIVLFAIFFIASFINANHHSTTNRKPNQGNEMS